MKNKNWVLAIKKWELERNIMFWYIKNIPIKLDYIERY